MLRRMLMPSLALFATHVFAAQEGGAPPPHPFLVDSPFPAVHMGPYRQASTTVRGPEPGDRLVVTHTPTPDGRASPWLHWSPRYPDGSRVIWGRTTSALFKALPTDQGLEMVASLPTEGHGLMMSNWHFLLLSEGGVLIKTGEGPGLWLVRETDATSPRSPLAVERTITIPAAADGEANHLMRLYDGTLAYINRQGVVGILAADLTSAATLDLELGFREVAHHNSMAADTSGRLCIVTNRRMLGVRWHEGALRHEWSCPFDFGGRRHQGSGTTPTLIGVAPQDDRLVVVGDSQTPARMIAFWRDEIPADWVGLPGHDRRVAGVVALPGTRPPGRLFTAIENSPTAWGYSLVVAQYNGFLGQPEATIPGVFRTDWHPHERQLSLRWTNATININSVMTYSAGSGLVYGSGRERDGDYWFYGLDWHTGEVRVRQRLGSGRDWDDGGCAVLIGDDRSVIFSSLTGIVRVRPLGADE